MIHRKSLLVWAGLALMGVLVAGCDKKAPDTGSASPSGEKKDPAKKIKIVYIPKNTGNAYFDEVIKGFKKAQGELGFEFDVVAPAKADATAQIPFIKQQTQQQVDAIAISPNSPDAIKPALKEAMAKGIKVITVDADMPGHEDGREAAVLPMDFGIVGKSQIELMSELLGGKGEFAILSATTDAPNQNFWIKGMQETLKDPKYKDLKLVEIAYGNDDFQKSLTETQALLTKHPNLNGILSPTSVGITAAAQAVETGQKADKVAVTGLGMPDQLRKFIQNGTMKKAALWSPSDMGYVAAHLLNGMVTGKVKPAEGGSFEAGTLKERKFGAKNTVISGPPLIFDKANIDQYRF